MPIFRKQVSQHRLWRRDIIYKWAISKMPRLLKKILTGALPYHQSVASRQPLQTRTHQARVTEARRKHYTITLTCSIITVTYLMNKSGYQGLNHSTPSSLLLADVNIPICLSLPVTFIPPVLLLLPPPSPQNSFTFLPLLLVCPNGALIIYYTIDDTFWIKPQRWLNSCLRALGSADHSPFAFP